MKGGFDSGNLVSYARDGLGMAPEAEFSLSDGRAKELLAQIAKGDQEQPFMELVAAYGREMRGIFAGRVKDAGEMEEVENEFGIKVVQIAGKYEGKAPVKCWLSVMAKRLAIAADRRMHRRSQFVSYQAEITAKMRDVGEEDDVDLESLADKDAVAEERERTPCEVLEQEELAKEAHQVVKTFLGSLAAETAEAVVRRVVEGIDFLAQTGKGSQAYDLRQQVSRAYRKMRQQVPPALQQALVHGDQDRGGR